MNATWAMTVPAIRLTALTLLGVLAGVAPVRAQARSAPRFCGDFRLRYEHTDQGNGTPSLGKEVLRLRFGMSYALRPDLVVRARLATGAPGDPNSSDVTLGQFVDDLAVSLDVASIELSRPHWSLAGGKFRNPLQSTELVWDGDVNPQGLAGRIVLGGPDRPSASLTGMYFIVDAEPGDSGSAMAGGQLALGAPLARDWGATAAAGYSDYRIRSLFNADAGDTRGNRLNQAGTAFLWDFNLLDLLGGVDYTGFGERLPVRLAAEYVHNFGASGPNTGWGADLIVGRSRRTGDRRIRYGYAVAETDAVLAAFAHDNTTLGTNSETHTLAVDAVPLTGLLLNATLYVYRPHEIAAGMRREYQHRLRLNATVMF